MGRPPRADNSAQIVAKARQIVLADRLREWNEGNAARAIASKDAREEVREMRSRLLPLIAAIQCDMLTGTLPMDAEWLDAAEAWLNRAEGKPAQQVNLNADLTQRITTVEVRQPCP